ncbi:MAG: hypothetical protein AVDCRST_MAG42-570 [uncultured Chthoniobacterales bacterium]|uniref:Prealbumin-like fold domain-containing protein n=1 Tax=uncultured Chthoniobacterales bacterium TaxID=1836801 RepID=A0A6J4HEC4_9BACT|nr:MAG: hypothetical protein AVDCRST_MAG42-570 [uncultured Chthoniobacterales bacterium]
MLAIAALGLWLPAVSTAKNGESGIEALFLAGPLQGGPARQGVPDSAPLARAPITIQRDGQTIATVTTDAHGRFRIPLPPGRYTVAVKGGKLGLGGCGPFDVDVVAGEFRSGQWLCDTGLQ